MATLAINKARQYELDPTATYNDLPAVATDILYEGSALGDSSGNARPLAAGDSFLGFCDGNCDNSAGAAGAKKVKVRDRGVVKLAVTSVASVDDIGATVYASDDDTFTLASTGNSAIGKVHRYVSSTTCWVAFEAASRRSI